MHPPEKTNLLILVSASAACAACLWTASHGRTWVLVLLAAWIFSFTANTLFSLLHEAVHGIFSSRRPLNEWAGRAASAWFPTGLSVQRAFHLTHHRYNRSRFEQFDVLHPGDKVWLKYAQWYSIYTGLYWAFAVAGAALFTFLPGSHRWRALRDRRDPDAVQTGSAVYAEALEGAPPVKARLEALFSFAFQVLLFWALDLSFAGWALCYGAFALQWSWLQYTDHAFSPLDTNRGAWNLKVGPMGRAFFLDYHLHLAHHQHPQAPWNRLRHLIDPASPQPAFFQVFRKAILGPRKVEDFPRFYGARAPEDARKVAGLCLLFIAVFGIGYGGASLFGPWVPWRMDLLQAWERGIPFIPSAAWIYLSLLPMLGLAPFLLRGWRKLFPLVAILSAETLLATLCFLFLPARFPFGERQAEGLAGMVFRFADRLNLQGNEFPSLHVAFAVTAALALGRGSGARSWRPWTFGGWAVAIAASTMLIHEHAAADVLGGLVLACAAWFFLAPRLRRPDFLAAVEAEAFCLADFYRFGLRHPRYWLIAAAILLDSLRGWRSRRALRLGFAFLQRVDDMLDGHRAADREPLEIARSLADALRGGAGDARDADLIRMAQMLASDLRTLADGEGPDKLVDILDVMGRDRRRVLEGAAWSREELREHLQATFRLSLDLLLMARGSKLRSADLPDLVDALAWCSVARDLREDLRGGLVNIPKEVLDEARAEGEAVPTGEEAVRHPAVREWLAGEHRLAADLLDRLERSLAALEEREGKADAGRGLLPLRVFTRSIRDFHRRRFPRMHGVLPVPAAESQPAIA